MNIQSKYTLTSFVALLTMIFGSVIEIHPQDDADIRIGKRETIHSKILEKEILLSIHIPVDYPDTSERYPLLCTFQTHFEQVSGTVKQLYDYERIPPMIVVRIDNYEFGYLTPTRIEKDPNSGKADLFLRFFEEELFPYMDSHYRTQPYRIVFSNSWGGLFGAYAILAKPEVFDSAIASIPWVIYDGKHRFIIRNAKQFLERTERKQNFLYMTMDDEIELRSELEAFVDILKNNPKQGLIWEYHYWPEENHYSTPYRSVYAGLVAIFNDWNTIPENVISRGLEGLQEYEITLKKKYGYDIGISSAAIRVAGQNLQNEERYEDSIDLYKYAISKDPEDPVRYVSLGRAYEASGQLDLAQDTYEKAYEVARKISHPQTKWVKNFLDRINQKIQEIRR